MKTTGDRILEFLRTIDRPATRREIAEKVGKSQQAVCPALVQLAKYGEINVIPRGYGTPQSFELKSKDGRHVTEFFRRIAVATRYKTGGMVLIDAKFSDQAKAFLQ